MNDVRLQPMRTIDYRDVGKYIDQRIFCVKQRRDEKTVTYWGTVVSHSGLIKIDADFFLYLDNGDAETFYVGNNAGDYNYFGGWRYYIPKVNNNWSSIRKGKRTPCRISDRVVIVGRDMAMTFENRFAGKKVPAYAVINNWADENKLDANVSADEVYDFKKINGLDGKFVFMYSGNIGLYYDLDGVLRAFDSFCKENNVDSSNCCIAFVGEGAVKDKLIALRDELGILNAVFLPYQDKENLSVSLRAADVHIVTNTKGIKGVNPHDND